MKENHFIHRIDKETINNMPLASFQGEVIIVRTKKSMFKAIEYLNTQTIVGVDTETRPSFHHGQHYPTSLVQISTETRCYLFQLKHIGFTIQLADFFANPKICKIGLAFRDDLAGLKRLRDFEPQNCIDIQNIVPQYGILDLGLQKIFAIIFSKKISKTEQLTNWDNDILTPDQARYASTDAWATLLIYKELLKTKKISQRKYIQLKEADYLLQLQHYKEMQQKKYNENKNIQSDDNHISEKK